MLSRRGFVAGAAGAAALAWLPLGRAVASEADPGPPGFPAVALSRQRFANWCGEIVVDDLWTCRPATASEALQVVGWAAANGWRVRPRGAMHGWSPICITPDTSADEHVVLLDTSALTAVERLPDGRVRAGAGTTLLALLTALEGLGLGIESVPAVGDVTVGGMLAIGAHGAAIPAAGERLAVPASHGSISHLVSEVQVVAWERAERAYRLRRFTRRDPELAAIVCSLGRALVVEVVLDVAPLRHLRCTSDVSISGAELFAPPGLAGQRSFAAFLAQAGRAEALWYPFTERPWLKVWTVAPVQPPGTRATTGPYPYPFSDHVPAEVAELARELVTGHPELAPAFGQLTYAVTAAGLAATASGDLWGPAKDVQLYIQATTLRVRELGLAVLTSRARVQAAASELALGWQRMVAEHAAWGDHPMNMPFEIRASALDGALGTPPILTATSPDPSSPELDVVLFTNPLTLRGTPGSDAFYAEYERFVRARCDAGLGRLRPEWSKSFAYAAEGPEQDLGALERIREAFRTGRPRPSSWDGAAATLDALDPAGVFRNRFLDVLLPPTPQA